MEAKEKIISRYLHNRWYKKALIISSSEPKYLTKIHSLSLVFCSGYLKQAKSIGCKFDAASWPFDHKFFDLIVIDHAFFDDKDDANIFLKQLHFCMADDGDIIIADTKNIRAYNLVSRFLVNGFLSKNLQLINKSDSIALNLMKRLVSKNFIAVFKKDIFFKFDGLEAKKLIERKIVCKKIYSNANIKQVNKKI